MEDLPHEFITLIGSFLRPKDRARLYLCCKYWRKECQGDSQIEHCRQFCKVIDAVHEIEYTTYTLCYNDAYGFTSIIMIPNKIVYSIYHSDDDCYYRTIATDLLYDAFNGSLFVSLLDINTHKRRLTERAINGHNDNSEIELNESDIYKNISIWNLEWC
jgi:hypothetical protein